MFSKQYCYQSDLLRDIFCLSVLVYRRLVSAYCYVYCFLFFLAKFWPVFILYFYTGIHQQHAASSDKPINHRVKCSEPLRRLIQYISVMARSRSTQQLKYFPGKIRKFLKNSQLGAKTDPPACLTCTLHKDPPPPL